MEPTAYTTIATEVADRVLTITLDRPDRLNAFTVAMQRELCAALDAADPLKLVPPHLPEPPKGRTLVVGAGKAAAAMALAVEQSAHLRLQRYRPGAERCDHGLDLTGEPARQRIKIRTEQRSR